MTRRWALICAAAVVAAVTVTAADPAGAGPAGSEATSYIVVLEGGTDAGAESHGLARAHGGQARHVYDHVLNGFNFVGSEQAARNLARNPNVQAVVPDGEAHILADTNPTGVLRIGADDTRTAGATGAGVTVAVIDTGIDLDHPDLVGNIDAASGYDCYNGDAIADDDNGHGTHVAGTIGAENNGDGVVGVAPGAALVPIKVLSGSGSGSWSSVICGIDHATVIGADVANMSLGGSGSDTTCDDSVTSTSDALHEALCDSVAAGVTHVVAAGNDSDDAANHVPAAFDEVITVSAFADVDGSASDSGCGGGGPPWARECDETLANFTNYGTDVVVAAPGYSIYSTDTGGGYSTKSGTSMASPHVAGVAALIKAAQPSTTPAGVEDIITQNGECPGGGSSGADGLCGSQWPDDSDDQGEPLLDAAAVVAVVGTGGGGSLDAAPSVDVINPTDGATVSGTVAVTATASDDDAVTHVEFFVDGVSVAVDTTSPYEYSWDTTGAADGSHTVKATATDTAGQTASDLVGVTVDNEDDLPIVSITNPADGATVSGTVAVTAGASDDKGVSQVEFFVDGVSVAVHTTSPYEYSWDTTTLGNGTSHALAATATDTAGQTASDSVGVTVDNSAPVISADVSYATEGGRLGTQHLLVTVTVTRNGVADSGASVSIDLDKDGVLYASGSGTTGSNGQVTFKLTNAPAGVYTTDVTQLVTSDGTDHGDVTENDPGFTKS